MRLLLLFTVFLLISCGSERKGAKNVFGDKRSTEIRVVEQLKIKDFDQIMESKKLRVVIQNAPTSYFIYRGQPMGYEYDLVSRVSNYFNLELEIEVVDDIETAMELVEKGHADVLAYNLTITRDRKERIAFTDPIYEIHQVLVQKKPSNWRTQPIHVSEKKMIRKTTDLGGKSIYVVKNSSHKSRLNHLADEIGNDINIVEAPRHITAEDLLTMIRLDSIEYAAIDDNVAKMYVNVYRDLDAKTLLSFEQKIAWAVNPDAKVWLDTLNYGIRTIKRKPELNMLFKRYYGNNSLVRGQVKVYGDSEYTDQLSDYDDLLKNYSKELDWDWRYLAALIYTESRFDPKKVSWAGAQGLMQLMPKTFASYGVKNPFNPEQNIKAGVAHLGWLQNYWSTKLPEDVDSMPFILASYNVGHGHVMDAIRLAQIENSDNFNWEDISQSLRNLSQPKYYTMQEVKYGFCRGSEPADYVKKIDKTYRSYSALVSE